jgi:hypothetical protein
MRFLRNAVLTGALLAPCAMASADVRVNVYVPVGPPLAVYEARPRPPATGYVWIPGYHRWNGGSYFWVSGRWEQPPHAHSRYVKGRWRKNTHGYYWVDGYWYR